MVSFLNFQKRLSISNLINTINENHSLCNIGFLIGLSTSYDSIAPTSTQEHYGTGTDSTPRKVTLSKTDTIIFEIPGVPAGCVYDDEQDCYCTACMKWASVGVTVSQSPAHFKEAKAEQSSEAKAMKKVYNTLQRNKTTCRFKYKTQRTIRPGVKGIRNASKHVSVKRYLVDFL